MQTTRSDRWGQVFLPRARSAWCAPSFPPGRRSQLSASSWHVPMLQIRTDRKSVVLGKSVSVRVDLGGRRLITKKKDICHTCSTHEQLPLYKLVKPHPTNTYPT